MAELPPGVIMYTAQKNTSEPPAGWMFCNGQSLNVNIYERLFSVIGYTYGGSGSSFNLPNLEGRVIVHRQHDDTDFDTVGETRGAKTHQLTAAEIPSHTHGYLDTQLTTGGSVASGTNLGQYNNSETTDANTGGGGYHNNIQPSMVMQAIIKVF